MAQYHSEQTRRHTIATLAQMSRGEGASEVFACMTCYDATMASWLEQAGVHVLLAGDSAAQLVLGHERTVDMSMEVAVALTAGVKRGAPNTVVMADMPFMSYQAEDAEGVRNAGRFLREGLADIVKFEVDGSQAGLIEKVTRAGIPVCAHVGSLPQRAAVTGGYKAAGRTAQDARRIVRDAVAMERAGASMLLVEAVPDEVAAAIVDATSVPLIGIGAGPACHGQIIVLHDLVGLTRKPVGFSDQMGDLGNGLLEAGREWVRRVAARDIGSKRYRMKAGEAGETGSAIRRSLRAVHAAVRIAL